MFAKIAEAFRDPRVAIPTATAAALVIVTGGTWLIFRSWLVAIAAALAIALVVLIVALLRTIRSQEREESLTSGLEERDATPRGGRSASESSDIGIDAIFSRAVADIRGAHLGTGDLYGLPWWLTLGAGATGKTELIRNAGLDVPAAFAHTLQPGPTSACNFVLTNQGVLLDTPGSFVDSGKEAPAEWLELLDLLKKHRGNAPLEGILITLSAARLLEQPVGGLDEIARTLRRRANETRDRLGFYVPIYVVVTHLDRIQGFAEVVSALPEALLREAVGWTNDRRNFADAGEIAAAGLDRLIEQLEQMLPEFLMREPDPTRRRRIFLFPQELATLRDRIAAVLQTLFAPSAYDDEVPFLRGVYLCSSVRGGASISSFAAEHGHDWSNSDAAAGAGGGGLFTADLFRDILAGDDELTLPTGGVGRRTRRVMIGLAAAVAVTVLALGAISAVGNYQAIDDLRVKTERLVDAPSSIDAVDAARHSIVAARADDAALGVPFMARTRMRAAQRSIDTYLWESAREHFRPAKDRLKGIVRRSGHDAFEALAVLAMDVSWLGKRADVERARRPNLVQYTVFAKQEVDRKAFTEGYDAYVRWLPDSTRKALMGDEREAVLAAATRLLDLRRLENWSATQQPVRHADFGIDPPAVDLVPEVLEAYTRRGWEELVRDLVQAVEDSGGAAEDNIARFRNGYVDRFDRSWRDFLQSTPTLPEASPAVFESPHLALFERIATEVATDLPRSARRPAWMDLVTELRREQAPPEPPAGEEDAPPPPPPPPPPWERYRQVLDQVAIDASAAHSQGGERALKVARGIGKASTFTQAIALIDELLPARGETLESSKLRQLLAMPVLDAAAAVMPAALPELDRRWDQEIASRFRHSLDSQQLSALYHPESGALAIFLGDSLAPFYERGEPTALVGNVAMPLSPGFLSWLDSAATLQKALFPEAGGAPEVAVRIEGVPSHVIGRSDAFVTRRDLRIDCAASVVTFEYREGSGSKSFVWRPDCQQVSLRIWVRTPNQPSRELLPRKEWNGPLALPRFLQDARPLGNGRYQWNLPYDGIELQIEYWLRAGKSLINLVHRAPPASLGSQRRETEHH